jgi:hypothetical protein
MFFTLLQARYRGEICAVNRVRQGPPSVDPPLYGTRRDRLKARRVRPTRYWMSQQ